MHIFLKLFYLVLFVGIDVLLYIRLGRNVVKAGRLLILVLVIWVIAFLAELPIFNLKYIPSFKSFLTWSAIVIQMLIVHYFGVFVIKLIERMPLLDEVKQTAINGVSFVCNTAIFAVLLMIHLLFILTWPG